MAHLCLSSESSLSISGETLSRAGVRVPSTSKRQIVSLIGRLLRSGYCSAMVTFDRSGSTSLEAPWFKEVYLMRRSSKDLRVHRINILGWKENVLSAVRAWEDLAKLSQPYARAKLELGVRVEANHLKSLYLVKRWHKRRILGVLGS